MQRSLSYLFLVFIVFSFSQLLFAQTEDSRFEIFIRDPNNLTSGLAGATVKIEHLPTSVQYTLTAVSGKTGYYRYDGAPFGTYKVIVNGAEQTTKIPFITNRVYDIIVKIDPDNNLQIDTQGIENSAVTTDKIANSAITTVKLNDLNVTAAKLSSASVTNTKLANNSVQTTNIVDSTIVQADLSQALIDFVGSGGSVTNNADGTSIVVGGSNLSVNQAWLDTSRYEPDTTSLKARTVSGNGIAVVYLKQISSTNTNGGGGFALIDSTYREGIIAFNSAVAGKQWVRIDWLINPGVVNAYWLGVAADNSTNDRDKFFSFSQNHMQNGWTLEVPDDTFLVDATNNPTADPGNAVMRFDTLSNITIRGISGKWAAYFRTSRDQSNDLIQLAGCSNVLIENIKYTGPDAEPSTYVGHAAVHGLDGNIDVTVRDLYIEDIRGHGVLTVNVNTGAANVNTRWEIYNNTIIDIGSGNGAGEDGHAIAGNFIDSKIHNNHIDGGRRRGIEIWGRDNKSDINSNVRIYENYIANVPNTSDGISLFANVGVTEFDSILVYGNWLVNCGIDAGDQDPSINLGRIDVYDNYIYKGAIRWDNTRGIIHNNVIHKGNIFASNKSLGNEHISIKYNTIDSSSSTGITVQNGKFDVSYNTIKNINQNNNTTDVFEYSAIYFGSNSTSAIAIGNNLSENPNARIGVYFNSADSATFKDNLIDSSIDPDSMVYSATASVSRDWVEFGNSNKITSKIFKYDQSAYPDLRNEEFRLWKNTDSLRGAPEYAILYRDTAGHRITFSSLKQVWDTNPGWTSYTKGYYTFEGNTIWDYRDKDFDLSISTGTNSKLKFDQDADFISPTYLYFDGGLVIQSTQTSAFNVNENEDFTLKLRILVPNSEVSPSGTNYIITKAISGNSYFVWGTSNGSTYVLNAKIIAGGSGQREVNTTLNVADSAWHTVTVTNDWDDSLYVYVDGTKRGTDGATLGGGLTNGTAFRVGGYAGSNGYTGWIDYVRYERGIARKPD
jgi:hypothetical protein